MEEDGCMSSETASWPDPEELWLLLERGQKRHLDAWKTKWGGGDGVDAAIARMWSSSTNGEALLSLANHASERKGITAAACACARLVLPIVSDGELRPARALDTAEAWCDGKATLEAVRAAANESFQAERAFYASSPTGAVAAACDAASFAALSAFGALVRVHADDSIEQRSAENVAQAVRVASARHVLQALVREDPRLSDVTVAASDPRAIAAVSEGREKIRAACAAHVRRFVPALQFTDLVAVIDPRRPLG